MSNVAILVGNVHYNHLHDLECVKDDLAAIQELLRETKKYAHIRVIENKDADGLKSDMRLYMEEAVSSEELFFYYTGHGCVINNEFFFCAQNFDTQRPNETGLSSEELHTLLRQANAKLVVKVIDSCNSGTMLIKSESKYPPLDKAGFNNIIQISSCLESQNSLAGNPLSFFTEKFRDSALRKTEGPVFYMDIIASLKDEFFQNEDQTPYFISQGTGREKFVDDARLLDELRHRTREHEKQLSHSGNNNQEDAPPTSDLAELLDNAESMMATAELVSSVVGKFFENLTKRLSELELDSYFVIDVEEYSYYQETEADEFIVRMLSKEKRTDEFVTAKVRREKKRSALGRYSPAAILGMFGSNEEYEDVYDLWLNMRMDTAQVHVTFEPKYTGLRKIAVVVTCAPSLEKNYIFEVVSEHRLQDFGEFHDEGRQIVRRWYKLNWRDSLEVVVDKIVLKADQVVRAHLNETRDRLMK